MRYPIVVVRQPSRQPLYVQVRGVLEVGRECDGLILADLQTSRRHATLSLVGDTVVVEDLKSTNGTFLDGTRISSPVGLTSGAVVKLGDTTLELVPEPNGEPARTSAAPGGARATTLSSAEGGDGRVRASGESPAGARATTIDLIARDVRETRPELTPSDFEGTITIVFSDIESSTERALSMGDTAWMKVLALHNDVIRRHVRAAQGREVKHQGDGFMLTFSGVHRALHCMIAIQRELSDFARTSPEQGVRIRVGMHTGEVIVEEGDIFGRHVMMAARVGGQADGGEILVSSLVREIASARGDIEFGEGRVVTMKGIEGEHVVYPVRWEPADG